MADAKAKEPEQKVEAAATETTPPVDDGKPKTITTNVFAPTGPVLKTSIIQAAIASVRDAIPVVFDLEADITGSRKTTHNKLEGTSFEVTITYTPRALAGDKTDPVDVDKVIKGLDAPSFDAVHQGDPNFLG